MATLKRRGSPTPCCCRGPLWLILFFLVPLYFMGNCRSTSDLGTYYPFDWHWRTTRDALSLYDTQFFRSFSTRDWRR